MIPFTGRYRPDVLQKMRQDALMLQARGQASDHADSLFRPNTNGDFTYTNAQLQAMYPELQTGQMGYGKELQDRIQDDFLYDTWDRGWRGVNATGKTQSQRGFSFSTTQKGRGRSAFGTGDKGAFGSGPGIFSGRTY